MAEQTREKRQGTDEPPKKRRSKGDEINVSVGSWSDLREQLLKQIEEHELKRDMSLRRVLENARAATFEDEISPGRVESIATIVSRAVEVIGSAEKAMRWLHTPVPSLGDTPIHLLATAEGAAKVENALLAIEDGAW